MAGTRVSLSSVVVHFQAGESPEKIVEAFPTLKLSQVYGAIAYYLENEELIKEYIAEVNRKFHELVLPLSQSNPALFARLETAREKMASNRALLPTPRGGKIGARAI